MSNSKEENVYRKASRAGTAGEDAPYGEETRKAVENFPLPYRHTNLNLIRAMILVKLAASKAYQRVLPEKAELYGRIARACTGLLADLREEWFPTCALQGGAGTSAHMNVNEVLAGLAGVHPLDDVNRGQSTNDVYPTALRIAAIFQLRKLSESAARLQQALQEKEHEFDGVKKLGRTELMDAVPITLGEEFGAYAQAVARDRWRLYKAEERLRQTNLGGTAVGAGNNADRKYQVLVIEELKELTGIGLARAEYPMDITQNQDVFVEVSGLLKAMAANLMKIAGDFRLMNSGPHGGIGEIKLKALQAGSTIMPGKVNPVIPEMVMQAGMKVLANDSAISMASAHGEFELNAFLPLIADCLLESLELLTETADIFREKCVCCLEAQENRCRELLEQSYAFAADYTPYLGYDTVSRIISEHQGNVKEIREILESLAEGRK